jgi:two-component system cell cycle sensor histidine kinase/response regulator CckA
MKLSDEAPKPAARAGGEAPRGLAMSWGARRPQSWTHILVFLLGMAAVAGVVWYQIASEYGEAIRYWEARQSGIADVRASMVSNWLMERRSDVELVATLPYVHLLLPRTEPGGAAPSPAEAREHIASVLDRFAATCGYAAIFLLDSNGQVRVRSPHSVEISPETRETGKQVIRSGRFRVDLLGAAPSTRLLSFAMPVVSGGESGAGKNPSPSVRGAVLFLMAPEKVLFPMLTRESVPTETGETLLVRHEGNELVFFSPLRHVAAGSRQPRFPLPDAPLAGRIALEGREGFVEYNDYRGVPVIAAARRIPEAGWGLVRKIDRAEALADLYIRVRLEVLTALLVVVSAGFLLRGHWRKTAMRFLEEEVARQQAVLELRTAVADSEKRLRDLVESLDAIVWEADARTLQLSFVNRRAEELLGYPVAQWLNAPNFLLDHVHPDDHEEAAAHFRAATTTEEDQTLTYRMLAADGRVVWMRNELRGIRDAEGSIRKLRGLMLDITERKQAEEARARLASIVESSEDAIISKSCDGVIQSWNRGAEMLYGYTASEMIGQSVYLLAPQDRASEVASLLERVSRGERVEHHETVRVRKDGRLTNVSVSISPVKDARGSVVGAASIARDITERKRAEEALRQSEERFRSFIENVPLGVYRTTPDGRVLMANPALLGMLGYGSFQELASRNLEHEGFEPADARSVFREQIEREGEVKGFEAAWKRQDGSAVSVREYARVVRASDGSVLCYDGVVEDITERRRLEQQLRQAQKMEAIGRLAGGVAHDFNNLLTIVNGYSDLILERLSAVDPMRPQVEEIKKAGERAAKLTRQLLAFSRRQVLAPQILDLNAVVSNMDKMLRRLIGEDIDVVAILEPELGRVKADPGQLEQVIMNLAVNARDAMPEGGTLTLETANVELDEVYASRHVPVTPGSYVMLAISDTGCGMDAETQAHIFEPFFTTKVEEKGTGLGLATVYGIVKQSGGYIWPYSELGRGTIFKIYLPRVYQPAERSPADRGRMDRCTGSETILVVEDEATVRALVRRVLESNGYSVLEASRAAEALAICQQHPGEIHLSLTDVVMPQTGGREFARRLGFLRPGTKILYMSG